MQPETAAEQQKYTYTEAGLEYRKVNRELKNKMKSCSKARMI